MADRVPYSFRAAPLQNPIVGNGYLTQPWFQWFVDLQRQFLVRWEDLSFPAQAINLSGAATDPARDAATGLLSFSGVADNSIRGVAQMPHGWLPGSVVRPHLHLRFPNVNAGFNTRWAFAYDVANVGADWLNASGTYGSLLIVTVANAANALRHVTQTFGDLVMTGFAESSCILWQLTRLAGTDALDDDNQTCLLVSLDLHYQIHKAGTVPEGP